MEQDNLSSFPVSAVSLALQWHSCINFAQIFEEIVKLRERVMRKSTEIHEM